MEATERQQRPLLGGGRNQSKHIIILAAAAAAATLLVLAQAVPRSAGASGRALSSQLGSVRRRMVYRRFVRGHRNRWNSLRGGGGELGDEELDMLDEDVPKRAKGPSPSESQASSNLTAEEEQVMEKFMKEIKQWTYPTIDNPPSNFLEGIVRGAGAVAAGTIRGAAAAAYLPCAGIVQAGVGGFVRGAVLGTLTGTLLAGGGIVTGGRIIGMGFSNTPKYCSNLVTAAGPYNLTRDKELMEREIAYRERIGGVEDEEDSHLDFSRVTSVMNMTHYNVLGVQTNASRQEIQRKYRLLAMKLHPDRYKSDKKKYLEVQEKFKQVVEAHRVLSNDKLRRKYNNEGEDETPSIDIEMSILLATVFGNNKFHNYLGELQPTIFGRDLSKMLEYFGTNHSEITPEEQEAMDKGLQVDKLQQRKREIDLACKLAGLLDRYVDDREVWFQEMHDEANKLNNSRYGGHLLSVLAGEYKHHVSQWDGMFLSRSLKRPFGKLTRTSRVLRQYYKIIDGVKGMMVAIATQQGMNTNSSAADGKSSVPGLVGIEPDSAQTKGDGDGDADNEAENQAQAFMNNRAIQRSLFNIFWNVVVLDIQRTLFGVCNKVLGDNGVSREQRLIRVKALGEMAQIFKSKSAKTGKEIPVLDLDMLDTVIRTARIRSREKKTGITPDNDEDEMEEREGYDDARKSRAFDAAEDAEYTS